jgi:ubiquinone/menaquinone biosynthesis C-methylase UbiE
MDNQQAYNVWADQYDTNINRTRDLEAVALRSVLDKIKFSKVLEIGCGTGKNSEWLVTQAEQVTAVDFSEEMLNKAKAKVTSPNINFVHADISKEWSFTNETFDLVTFSLVLEHIEDLDFIFREAKKKITNGGYLYVGELHPFKQYSGSLARFDNNNERVELQCFVHHISEFADAALNNGFSLTALKEWFDEDNQSLPRILTLLFQASESH